MKLPSKPVLGIVVIATVALLTWTVGRAIAAQSMGATQFDTWRDHHMGLFFLMWIGAVIVITLPILWVLGTRLAPHYARQDEETAAAKGVGRLAARALEGRQAAKDQLLELLDDESTAVRCQAARALALLAEPDTDREVRRKVRYWPGDVKLALVDNLGRSRDMRTASLLKMLTSDRSPTVSRRASTALAVVSPTTVRWDDLARGRKQHLDKVAAKSGQATSHGGVADAPGDVPGQWEMGLGEAPPMRTGSIAKPRPRKPAGADGAGKVATRKPGADTAGARKPGARPAGTRPAGARPASGTRPADAKPADCKPPASGPATGARPAGTKPPGTRSKPGTRPAPRPARPARADGRTAAPTDPSHSAADPLSADD